MTDLLFFDVWDEALREGDRLRARLRERCTGSIVLAGRLLASTLAAGNKVLVFGNGGSAADAQHIAAELVGRFKRERRALPALALAANSSTVTAIGNDYGFEHVFARQVSAFGRTGDLALALSTSGASLNVLHGAEQARAMGMRIIALLGERPSPLGKIADVAIAVPSFDTERIQECHITIGHVLCAQVDESLGEPYAREEGEAWPVPATKAIDLETLVRLRAVWRKRGVRFAWAAGPFTELSRSTVVALQEVAVSGVVVGAGVVLGGADLGDAQARARMVAELACVDRVAVIEDAGSAAHRLAPDVHVAFVRPAPGVRRDTPSI